jgi:transposase
MPHRNARLTVHGRQLLVDRVASGRPVAHVASELGVSRQCAHRWVARYRLGGREALADRSSRPRRSPTKTPVEVEQRLVELRRAERRGQDWLGPELGVPARTVSRVLRRHQLPYLRDCDPLTGQPIRSSKATAARYERDRPGELVHMDVKKIGKIPDGGGWKAHGRAATKTEKMRQPKIGYDYVHSLVDDHSRLAYSEILPDEKGATCAGFCSAPPPTLPATASNGSTASSPITPSPTVARPTSSRPWLSSVRGTSSSDRTVRGRTARLSGSTAPCRSNGPIGTSSSATPSAPPLLPPG